MATALATTFDVQPSQNASRFVVGSLVGLAVTAGLFWIMQYLIETAEWELGDESVQATLDFVRVIRDEDVRRRKIDDIMKPPPPDTPPEVPQFADMTNLKGGVPVSGLAPPEVSGGTGAGFLDGWGLPGEGDYLPIVKVEPIYPRRALAQGLEGFCVVQYTVTSLGTVRDPAVVEDQCSSSLFARVSAEAVLKFKYKPRVVDGVALEVTGVRNKFIFQISD